MHLPSGLKVKDKLLYWYDSLFFPFAIMLQFSVPFSKAAGMPIISRRITGVIVCLSMTPFGRLKKSDDYKTRHVWKALPNNNGSIHTQKSRCTQIIHHSLYSQHAREREREREKGTSGIVAGRSVNISIHYTNTNCMEGGVEMIRLPRTEKSIFLAPPWGNLLRGLRDLCTSSSKFHSAVSFCAKSAPGRFLLRKKVRETLNVSCRILVN